MNDVGGRVSPTAEPLAAWTRLIETMLDAVWLVDARELRILAANRAAGALMATNAAEFVGRDVRQLSATPEDLCFWSEVARGLADRIESDTLVNAADGTTKAVTRRVGRMPPACVDDQGGGADVFVVVMHDRSAQMHTERELEAAVADLCATLESTLDGLLVTDLSGRIRKFNQRFARMWAIAPELLERHDDDAVLDSMRRSVTDPAGYMRRLAAIDDATLLQASDLLRLRSGELFERMTTPQRLHGVAIGRIYAFREITEKPRRRPRIEPVPSTDLPTHVSLDAVVRRR